MGIRPYNLTSQIIVAGNIYTTGLRNVVVLAPLSKNGTIDASFRS